MIEPRSFESPKLQSLIRILMDWLNDELADYRIIVQDIEEDLYDGQVKSQGLFNHGMPSLISFPDPSKVDGKANGGALGSARSVSV